MALSKTISVVPTLLLGGLSALHVAWARGSTVPYDSAKELSRNVTGQKTPPTPGATATVAGALGVGTALSAGFGQKNWFGRLLRRGLMVAMGARAVTGYRGTTLDVLDWKANKTFAENDRRVFAPLCAVIAVGLFLSDPAWRRKRRE
ncbi:DUF3995 domain-containing protein, partial [Leucobacter sp. M11]|uniref:DUF3995 domain-containing protein n=1 Tax=Leucobacter sp. M11 TaxID=2993565 RepID=UPI002D7F702A